VSRDFLTESPSEGPSAPGAPDPARSSRSNGKTPGNGNSGNSKTPGNGANGRSYLQVGDVVERYGGALSQWTVYELARTGQIPHRKHAGGKRLLFLAAELDAWDDGEALQVRKLPRGGRVVTPRKQGS
jgi:predicted DNA-binding transcriptional regulator AlpA